MDWLSVVIEEYKTLREESLTAMQTQQSILRVGTAIVGVVLVTGLNLWEKFLLPEFIFLFFTPLASYLVIIIWMGELERMVRVGTFIAQLEKKVNKEFGDKPEALTWESRLRTKQAGKTPQLLWNYRAILGIFSLMALASIVLGIYKIYDAICFKCVVIISLVEVLLFLGLIFWYINKERYLKRQT